MPRFLLTAKESATVQYWIDAEDEADARRLFTRGEFDDYKTVDSEVEDIISITKETP